jgi:uncharacterized protein (TIGR02145 family)
MRLKECFAIGLLFFSTVDFQGQPNKTVIKDSITDNRDGHVYQLVKIGATFWMSENLNWDSIGCFIYDNKAKNELLFGRLYSYDLSRKACPTGTHLPTKSEWDSLDFAVDPKGRGDAGDKLTRKSAPGFSATIGGFRNSKEKFVAIKFEGWYWGENNTAYIRKDGGGKILFINDRIEKNDFKSAYYIRCIKD